MKQKIKKINFKNLKKKNIKTKIINFLMKNGKRNKGEKIIVKTFKELQKYSTKQSKKLLQLSVIASLPTTKTYKIRNKKNKKKTLIREVPIFIKKKTLKISLAIKFILKAISKKKNNFFTKFKQEIILNSQFKSTSITFKNELQKQSLIKKHYLINLQ